MKNNFLSGRRRRNIMHINNDIKLEEENNEMKINKDIAILKLDKILYRIGQNSDVKVRSLCIEDKKNNDNNLELSVIYIDGLCNTTDISDFIISPILNKDLFSYSNKHENIFNYIKNSVVSSSYVEEVVATTKAVSELLSGSCLLLFKKIGKGLVFDLKKFEKRSITEPSTEGGTKASKDIFVEDFRTNTATIRRKIKSEHLVIEGMTIGEQTNTPLGIIYMKNIVNEEILSNLKTKLKEIHVDEILTTAYIEEYLKSENGRIFPQIVITERPDKVCADIIEGRIAIVIDGIPFGFIVPATFVQYMQTSEDYSKNTVTASIIRLIRYICLIIALYLPGFYIAITVYHPEMIPTNLALFIAKSREGVTFPIALETLLMLAMFEILFEAGIRIPKTIGQAVSIVGTLVVGQAAVEAKLLSPSVVVIVAITVIASFVIPNQDFSNSIRLFRIIVGIFAAFLGLIGIFASTIILLFELCKIETFGIAYLSPLVDNKCSNLSKIFYDTFIRLSLRSNNTRPKGLKVKNEVRISK